MSLTPFFCSFRSLLFCVEIACGGESPTQTNHYSPRFSSVWPIVEAHVFIPRCVVLPFTLVPPILQRSSIPKVDQPIVLRGSVNVVYLVLRVAPMRVKPRQTVRQVGFSVKVDYHIPVRIGGPHSLSRTEAGEDPSQVIVGKGLFKKINSQFAAFHGEKKRSAARRGKIATDLGRANPRIFGLSSTSRRRHSYRDTTNHAT